MCVCVCMYVCMYVSIYVCTHVCTSATPIGDWTPSPTDGTKGGNLWVQFMVPLLPMTFKAVLWDQVWRLLTGEYKFA